MATAPRPEESPSPAIIFDKLTAYQQTAALRAAIEIDLFRAVGEGPADAAAIAQRCKASVRGTRVLCDYLAIMGLLQKDGSIYRHSATSAAFLDPRSPACIAATALFMAHPALHEPFDHLADIVRNGRTTLDGNGSMEPDHPMWVDFAHSMAPMMAQVAGPLGAIAVQGFSGPIRVLDIAAGHGLFGIEVAKQNPQAQIVAVDWAPVLEVAKGNAARAGVADRFQTLPGNAFEVDYGGPYDIVLITNFLHHFDVPTCVMLLKRIRAVLNPGGRAATLEFVPNEDRISPPTPASFSLMMLASTVSGDAYTFSELQSMYHQAGFSGMTAQPLPRSPHTVVMGYAT